MRNDMVMNANGVLIKKCCASCKHKEYSKLGDRICMKGEGEVPKDFCCRDWGMSEGCNNYKLAETGHTKKPHYIKWLKAQVSEIVASPSITDAKIRQSMIEALPAKYEKVFGSRYL